MMTLKEYAKLNNITYEAVRSQVNRYREQLGDHIILDGRQQFLDDYAVEFLDERRQKNPVVVYNQSKDEAIEEMRRELEGAYKTITALQQFKIAALENSKALEDARTAQERRERELNEREGQMTRLISEASQKASEDARKAVEEEKDQEIAQIRKQAASELETAIEQERAKHKAAMDKMSQETAGQLEAKDRKIQELERRSLGDYLMGWFRKRG